MRDCTKESCFRLHNGTTIALQSGGNEIETTSETCILKGGGIMAWVVFNLKGYNDLLIFTNPTINTDIYRYEVLDPHVKLFSGELFTGKLPPENFHRNVRCKRRRIHAEFLTKKIKSILLVFLGKSFPPVSIKLWFQFKIVYFKTCA